jgi:hypothetical protein
MSIVLSHTTAKAVYQAAHSVSAKDIESCNPAAIYESCPTGTLLDAAAEWLTKHDVSLGANDSLEVMVFDRRNARYAMNCQCHVGSVEKVGVRALAAPVFDIRNQLIS